MKEIEILKREIDKLKEEIIIKETILNNIIEEAN